MPESAYKARKDARVLNIRLDSEIYRELEDYCASEGLTKTAAVEDILDTFIKEYFLKKNKGR